MIKIKELFMWLFRSWPISIPLLYSLFPFLPFCHFSNNYYLYSGTVLETLGVILVIFSVDSKLKQFGKPGLFKSLREYFKSFPSFRKKSIHCVVVAEGARATMSASGSVVVGIDNMNNNEAIRYLYNEILSIQKTTSEIDKRISNEITTIMNKIDKSKEESISKYIEVNNRMEKLLAANYKFELFASLLLVFGVIYNNVPDLMVNIYKVFK